MSTSIYLPPGAWRGIYRVMQRPNANALRVSVETGMRIGDVLALTPIQITHPTFTYTAQKTGKEATVSLSLDLWRELVLGMGKHWVFPGRDPRKHRTRQAVYRDVKKAAMTLGHQGQVSPHSARKTFAVELRKAEGVDAVQKALQHTDRHVTDIYAYSDVKNPAGIDIDALAELIAVKVFEKIKQMFDFSGKN